MFSRGALKCVEDVLVEEGNTGISLGLAGVEGGLRVSSLIKLLPL